jgi:hypothetical protein
MILLVILDFYIQNARYINNAIYWLIVSLDTTETAS